MPQSLRRLQTPSGCHGDFCSCQVGVVDSRATDIGSLMNKLMTHGFYRRVPLRRSSALRGSTDRYCRMDCDHVGRGVGSTSLMGAAHLSLGRHAHGYRYRGFVACSEIMSRAIVDGLPFAAPRWCYLGQACIGEGNRRAPATSRAIIARLSDWSGEAY